MRPDYTIHIQIQKVVHDHHKDFLEASRDISDVEGLVDELRNYVSGGATVVANLLDLPQLPQQVGIWALAVAAF